MKQRISAANLMELTPEQQEKLRDIWTPEYGDMYINSEGTVCLFDAILGVNDPVLAKLLKLYCLPLLNIGQCIQLLESRDRCINITNAMFGIEHDDKFSWEVRLRHLNALEYQAELVNCLWQAVKEIL